MTWPLRHVAATFVVAVAVFGIGAVFVFARPVYHPVSGHTVNMANEDHYTLAEVRAAFAANGFRLVKRSKIWGTTYLADKKSLGHDDGLLVSIYDPHSKVDFNSSGPRIEFQKRAGNVQVEYSGTNKGFEERVHAAFATIKN
jgi:hypothetical protein